MEKHEVNAKKTRTIRETAAMLEVSIPTLRRAIAAGEIPVIRIGSRVLISNLFLENMLAGK
jgi:excisionase family DNA binding protein